MKNSQRGFIVPLLLLIIAVLLVGGGAYVYQNNASVETDSLVATTTTQTLPTTVKNTAAPAPVASLPSTCIDDPTGESAPVITSISPTSGPVGTEVTIKGCNLGGFENDHNLVFERSDGSTIPLYGGSTGPDTITKVVLESYCESGTVVGLYSGMETPCKTVVATPGVYKVYATAWGKKSNAATFTITSNTSGIQIIAPRGGETLKAGMSYTIRWSNYVGRESLNVVLQTTTSDGEVSAQFIASGVSPTAQSYIWNIPPDIAQSKLPSKYKIEIYSPGAREGVVRSDYFSITCSDCAAPGY